MDFSALVPAWLDAFLIAPFRWPGLDVAGVWLGSAFLAAYAVILGELSSAALFLLHHRYYGSMQDNVVRYHNLSVEALHAGNKEAYLGANKMAQETFGKSFFAQATVGFASLWPVPFALGWMALRFEGIVIYTVPVVKAQAGYVFVFLSLYIALRIAFSKTLKGRIPLFRRVEDIRRRAREERGKAKSFFNPPPEKDAGEKTGADAEARIDTEARFDAEARIDTEALSEESGLASAARLEEARGESEARKESGDGMESGDGTETATRTGGAAETGNENGAEKEAAPSSGSALFR